MSTQPANIVLEIRGGTAVAVYSSDPESSVILVDWDEFKESGRPGVHFPTEPLSEMPADTLGLVTQARQIEHRTL